MMDEVVSRALAVILGGMFLALVLSVLRRCGWMMMTPRKRRKTMLVLTVNECESVQVGEIKITVIWAWHNRCRLGFEGPREIEILRTELLRRAEPQPQPVPAEPPPAPAYRPCCLPIGPEREE